MEQNIICNIRATHFKIQMQYRVLSRRGRHTEAAHRNVQIVTNIRHPFMVFSQKVDLRMSCSLRKAPKMITCTFTFYLSTFQH